MTDTDSSWKKVALQMGLSTEKALDRIKNNASRFFGADYPLRIQVYKAFGTPTHITVFGRILNCRAPEASDVDSIWANLHASFKRFETDEVPGALVSLNYGSMSESVHTDEEGYFSFDLDSPPIKDRLSTDISVQLTVLYEDETASIHTPVKLVNDNAKLGVISDIDDTIILTQASSLVKMIKLTLLESSETRVAFEGVPEFYRALEAQGAPFFYVSSSPWNLHQFLLDFMTLNNIPTGAMFLRDFGLGENKLIAGTHKAHKIEAIESILASTDNLSFILSGDSGQRDPEVYAEVVRRHPERIKAIYIRDVSGAARDNEVQLLIDEVNALGVDMLLVPDTGAAAGHAAARGFISKGL